MPPKSRRQRLDRLQRTLLSGERFVDALLVVQDHEGAEIFRVGGCWDTYARRYVDRPCTARVVQLQESQREAALAFARWLAASLASEPRRRRLSVEAGNRGSGKTFLEAGVFGVAVALAFPREWQFIVNITAKQRRECLEHMRAVASPKWITFDSDDFRDLNTEFLTGAKVQWHSSRAAGALRQAGLRIRRVVINEGQDQPEDVIINAIAAIRNVGGEVGVATNPPRAESGDWVAALWQAIEADEINGERFELDNKKNRAIDQDAVSDIADIIRAVNREAAEADADGVMRLSGPIAYPAFKALAREKGGHIGEKPTIGWTDVTLELTAKAVGGKVGYDFVCGVDWQKTPGVVGQIAKLYRDERGRILLHVVDTVGVRGVEADFSQALIAGGYVPKHGMPGKSLLIIGDASGARQNAEHKWQQPTSYTAMQADGWVVLPPMYHWKTRTAWNPLVKDSRAQMHLLFSEYQIIYAEACRTPAEGFASLVESTRRAKVGPRGGLIEKGGFQHCPDGVRYLAWAFLPRPQPPQTTSDAATDSTLRGIRIFEER
jgi:hypothetical protein